MPDQPDQQKITTVRQMADALGAVDVTPDDDAPPVTIIRMRAPQITDHDQDDAA